MLLFLLISRNRQCFSQWLISWIGRSSAHIRSTDFINHITRHRRPTFYTTHLTTICSSLRDTVTNYREMVAVVR